MTTLSKAERTRRRIVEEAAKLFNTKGYAGTCIRDIMEATGLAKGGIYGNFENKRALELAAFEHALEVVRTAVRQRMDACAAAGGRAVDQLYELLAFYQQYVLNPPVVGGCPILNTAVEADDTDATLRRRVVRALDDWRKMIVRILRSGIESGEIRATIDPDHYAVIFIAVVEGAIMMARAYGSAALATGPLDHIRWLVETQLKGSPGA